jgi:hypothetical protein
MTAYSPTPVKRFTQADIDRNCTLPHIYADQSDLLDAPLPWQRRGLQQTASGYGLRLTSRYMIHFGGKFRRLYVTCISNAASTWFTVRGEKVFVS